MAEVRHTIGRRAELELDEILRQNADFDLEVISPEALLVLAAFTHSDEAFNDWYLIEPVIDVGMPMFTERLALVSADSNANLSDFEKHL